LFSSFLNLQVFATHTNIFVPVLEMEPESPIAGHSVKVTTVLTNKGNMDMSSIKLSISIDGEWMNDDINVSVPAQKSARVSFTIVMSVTPGEHQLKACPDRESLGEDGHQCRTLDFIVLEESAVIVTILSPKEEETLRGNATIKVAALGEDVSKVELYILNKLVDTKYEAPFDFTFDTSKYEDGKYKLYAIAYYDSGISKPSSVKKYFITNSDSVIVTAIPGATQEAQAKVRQNVVIESDITNGQPFKIAATFIVLIKDSDGFTEFLSWREERISSNETFPMSKSWIPETAGGYTVQVFLWDTIESAVPLTDVMKANIVVS
ncbi:MAG: Ig-like domain-containing protein, partial [Nitrososphaerales archaeon]